eukprot:scaffold1146_cov101-Cylindrotheca_fusiformis.AAC.3
MRKQGHVAFGVGLLILVGNGLRLFFEYHGFEMTSDLTYPDAPIPKSNATLAVSGTTSSMGPDAALADSPFVVGKLYSDKPCVLDPPWGMPSNWTLEKACSGKPTRRPFSTATHLTCDDKPSKIRRSASGLTVALLHFANPSMLRRQLDTFSSYPVEVQKVLTILIIDDGSPQGLQAKEYISDVIAKAPFRIRIALITTDVAWNIGGARNLAFHIADTSKILLLDLDMLIPVETMERILTLETKNSSHTMAHRFNRRRPNGRTGLHPAVSLMEVDAYWESGGCDEDFCGRYGFTDVHFWKRWSARKGRLALNKMRMFVIEVQQKACDPTYITNAEKFKTCNSSLHALQLPPKDAGPNRQLMSRKFQSGCWSPSYLRFAWTVQL